MRRWRPVACASHSVIGVLPVPPTERLPTLTTGDAGAVHVQQADAVAEVAQGDAGGEQPAGGLQRQPRRPAAHSAAWPDDLADLLRSRATCHACGGHSSGRTIRLCVRRPLRAPRPPRGRARPLSCGQGRLAPADVATLPPARLRHAPRTAAAALEQRLRRGAHVGRVRTEGDGLSEYRRLQHVVAPDRCNRSPDEHRRCGRQNIEQLADGVKQQHLGRGSDGVAYSWLRRSYCRPLRASSRATSSKRSGRRGAISRSSRGWSPHRPRTRIEHQLLLARMRAGGDEQRTTVHQRAHRRPSAAPSGRRRRSRANFRLPSTCTRAAGAPRRRCARRRRRSAWRRRRPARARARVSQRIHA